MTSLSEDDPTFSSLWHHLHGASTLWHVTSLESLGGIFGTGALIPNSGCFEPTYGQSRVSYAWHLGAISLFDFDSSSAAEINDHEWKWKSVLVQRFPPRIAVGIDRGSLNDESLLLPTQITQNDARLENLPDKIKRGRMVIPAVEALHIGPIPTSSFVKLILMGRDDEGRIMSEVFGADLGALAAIKAASTLWVEADARRIGARHERGEFTFAECVQTANTTDASKK